MHRGKSQTLKSDGEQSGPLITGAHIGRERKKETEREQRVMRKEENNRRKKRKKTIGEKKRTAQENIPQLVDVCNKHKYLQI